MASQTHEEECSGNGIKPIASVNMQTSKAPAKIEAPGANLFKSAASSQSVAHRGVEVRILEEVG